MNDDHMNYRGIICRKVLTSNAIDHVHEKAFN